MTSLLNFMNKFGKTKIDEKVTEKEETPKVDTTTKPMIAHTQNVLIINGTYKGYYGWVKEKIPKLYYVQLDEKEMDTKGSIKKITNFEDYRSFINEQRILTKYNNVFTDTRNRGISFFQNTFYVFDKNDIENFDDEKYKTWNWNVRNGFFDKPLTDAQKEQRTELELGDLKLDNMNLDEKTIENEILCSIGNKEFALSDIKIVILRDNKLYEFVKLTNDKVLARQYDISIGDEIIDQQKSQYNIKQAYNDKIQSTTATKIRELNEMLESYIRERTNVNKKIQSYDKVQLQKTINLLETENTDSKNDEKIKYLDDLINIDKISKKELDILNNKYADLSDKIYNIKTEIDNYNKTDGQTDIISDSFFENYLLTNLSQKFKEKRIQYKEDTVYLDTTTDMKLFGMVNSDVNLGLYDSLKLVDIYYKDSFKIIKVSDNMITAPGRKTIGSRVEITKGLYRNKSGIITEITPSKIYIYIDAINRLVNTHLKDGKEMSITTDDIIYLDVLDNNNVYYQVLSIENVDDINLANINLPESGLVDVSDYQKIGINEFRVKSAKETKILHTSDISRYNPGFEIKYKIKRKRKGVEKELTEVLLPEEEKSGDLPDELDNDSNAGEFDYGDGEEEELKETSNEQEYKASFNDIERSSVIHTEMGKSQREIFQIIQKLNKVEYIVSDEYKYIDEIFSMVQEIRKKNNDINISKKELLYIVLIVMLYRNEINTNIDELINKLIDKKYFNKTQFQNNFFLKGLDKELKNKTDADIINIILSKSNDFLGENFNIRINLKSQNNKTQLFPGKTPIHKLHILDYIFNKTIIEKYIKKCEANIKKMSDGINKDSIILTKEHLWNLPLYLHEIKVAVSNGKLERVLNGFVSTDNEKNKLLLKTVVARVNLFKKNINDDIINQNFGEYIKVIDYGKYFYIVEKHKRELSNNLTDETRVLYNNFTRLPFYIKEIDPKSELYNIAKKYLSKIIYDISIERKKQPKEFSKTEPTKKDKSVSNVYDKAKSLFNSIDKNKNKRGFEDDTEPNPVEKPKFKQIKLQGFNDEETNPLIESIKYSSSIDEKDIDMYLNKSSNGFEPITYAFIHSTPDTINKLLEYSPYISIKTLMIAIQSSSQESIKIRVKTEIAKRIITEISEEKEEDYKLVKEVLDNNTISQDISTIDSEIVKHYKNIYRNLLDEYTTQMTTIVKKIINLKPELSNSLTLGSTPLSYAIRFAPMDIIKEILQLTSNEYKTIKVNDVDIIQESLLQASSNSYLTTTDIETIRETLIGTPNTDITFHSIENFSDSDDSFDMEIDN